MLKSEQFNWYSLALDETATAQLLDVLLFVCFFLIRGVDDDFCLIQKLLWMKSMKDATTGDDLIMKVKGCIEKRKIP